MSSDSGFNVGVKNKSSVPSLVEIRSQKISETRELGFERLRAKIKEQEKKISGFDNDGLSR